MGSQPHRGDQREASSDAERPDANPERGGIAAEERDTPDCECEPDQAHAVQPADVREEGRRLLAAVRAPRPEPEDVAKQSSMKACRRRSPLISSPPRTAA